ncbi:unnamed protein product, partial [Urochloa humidicola]
SGNQTLPLTSEIGFQRDATAVGERPRNAVLAAAR